MSIKWIGERYGRLTVLSLHDQRGYKKRWLCRCDCSEHCIVQDSNLRGGHTISCGCFQRERGKEIKTTHGMTDKVEHDAWINMKQRCNNPHVPRYKDYGARGIKVCTEWLDDFDAFFAHVGPRPSPQHSIDRIDNERGYEPGNVRWMLRREQNLNRRRQPDRGKRIEFEGQSMTIRQLARHLGLKPSTLYKRLDNGWSLDDLRASPDQRFAS